MIFSVPDRVARGGSGEVDHAAARWG